jgi:hypothetical protein
MRQLSISCQISDHSVVLSLLFAGFVYSYYCELLDPLFGAARRRPVDNTVPLDTFRNYDRCREYAAGSSMPYNAGAAPGRRPTTQSGYVPAYEPSKLPGYGQTFGETSGDPDKKVPADEEKDLSGVPH